MAAASTDDLVDRFTAFMAAPTISVPSTSLPAASEHERELAQQATNEFDRGNFDSCYNMLTKLGNTRASDPKLLHNRAVVEYHKSGFVRTDEFKQALLNVCQRVHVNLDSLGSLEDADHCILFYNHAVIFYHLRQYRKALTILDKVFTFVEPMEECLSRKVMLLLMELYLCTHQPEKAMGMLAFLEKNLFSNGKSSDKESSASRELKESLMEAFPSNTPNEAWRPRINMYKARCYMMLKSMKSCKREVKGLMSTVGMNAPVTYIKANFEYLRNNHRKAIKVLSSCSQPSGSTSSTGECLSTMYYNNLGVIHFHMKKPNLGALYFRKAIQENGLAVTEYNSVDPTKNLSGRPLQTIAVSRHCELLYNMGVQQLHCGRPVPAFECLIETVPQYQINPRLWLRLAECCVMAYKKENDEDRDLCQRLKVIQGSVGSGVHRKLILGPGMQKQYALTDTPSIPDSTLEFASLCLRNALMLLPQDPVLSSPPSTPPPDGEQGDAKSSSESLLLPAPPGNPIRAPDIANLRCCILVLSAYVSLCLNDHLVALQHAEQLLKQPKLSGAHRYLGHQYMAEALVAVDRIADAVQLLNPDLVTDVGTIIPDQKPDQEKNGDGAEMGEAKVALYEWSPKDVPTARAIMQYNLATAHAIRGEYEKALLNLSKSTHAMGMPLPAQVYFLKLYLELMEGRRKTAQGIIKEHFGHVTPNRV